MDKYREKAEECLAFLKDHDDFVVCGHPNPDGDSVGSLVAVCDLLSLMGKRAQGILFAPIPNRYTFMRGTDKLLRYTKIDLSRCGALVCLDLGARERIDKLIGMLPEGTPILNIDHHTSITAFGTVNWICDAVSAAGEMVYNIIKASGKPFTETISEGLYVAIVTDTGRLCYRNTRAATLEACADLVKKGVDPTAIFMNLFERSSRGRLDLLALALSTLESAFDDQVSSMMITEGMYSQTQTSHQDTYEFIDMVQSIAGTRVALLFRELQDDKVKLSVRSDGSVSADELCRVFGGGGHPCAAGAVVTGDLTRAREKVLAALEQLLEA